MHRTLFNLFTKARHPERVHVGVVQQNNEGDVGPSSSLLSLRVSCVISMCGCEFAIRLLRSHNPNTRTRTNPFTHELLHVQTA